MEHWLWTDWQKAALTSSNAFIIEQKAALQQGVEKHEQLLLLGDVRTNFKHLFCTERNTAGITWTCQKIQYFFSDFHPLLEVMFIGVLSHIFWAEQGAATPKQIFAG